MHPFYYILPPFGSLRDHIGTLKHIRPIVCIAKHGVCLYVVCLPTTAANLLWLATEPIVDGCDGCSRLSLSLLSQ